MDPVFITANETQSSMPIDPITVNSANQQRERKPRILIVDDSRVVRVSLTNILSDDYELIEAVDGADAWERLQQEPGIRLVISDLSMPRLDGLGLLQKIRNANEPRVRNIPTIIVTGREEDAQMRGQLLGAGASELVTKPFDASLISQQARRYTREQQPPSEPVRQDLLSGISDRLAFSQEARKELSFAIRNKNELVLALLQIDRFEAIIAHYSEPAIEHILITMAEIIRVHTHIEDKLAYFGEGTFAILLPATNAIGTKYLGRRILSDLVAKQFYLGESDTAVTASMGISAPAIKPGTTFSEILSLAEQRLLAAIDAGGNRVVDKGSATLSPVSEPLPEESADDFQEQILRQTELEMRELAAQEVKRIKARQEQTEAADTGRHDFEEFLLLEQENKLLKEELTRQHQLTHESGRLKQQLHQTDSLLQQTQLKLQQLRTDYETMRIRAEAAEAGQSRLEASETDRTTVEEHLLQETEQLQQELNEARHRLEQEMVLRRKAEQQSASLEEQLQLQKSEFDFELAEEHMLRSMAEQKLADLEARETNAGPVQNRFSLTSVPLSAPTASPPPPKPSPPKPFQQPIERHFPVAAPRPSPATRPPARPTARPAPRSRAGRAGLPWGLILFSLVLIGLLATAGYQYRMGMQARTGVAPVEPQKIERNTNVEAPPKAMPPRPEQPRLSPPPGKPTTGEPTTGEPTTGSAPAAAGPVDPEEEARLQAELLLREEAEARFQKLVKNQPHPPQAAQEPLTAAVPTARTHR